MKTIGCDMVVVEGKLRSQWARMCGQCPHKRGGKMLWGDDELVVIEEGSGFGGPDWKRYIERA